MVTIKLTDEQFNKLVVALSVRPWAEVADLMTQIFAQVNPQPTPAPTPSP